MNKPTEEPDVSELPPYVVDPTYLFSGSRDQSLVALVNSLGDCDDELSLAAMPEAEVAGDQQATAIPSELDWLSWLSETIMAENRVAGAEVLCRKLAEYFGAGSVRIALGKHSMKRIFDHRLGWLSRDSDLWTEGREYWDASSFEGTWRSWDGRDSVIGFCDRTKRSSRMMIWVSAARLEGSSLRAMQFPLEVMSTALYRLPKRSFPIWDMLFGKHPWVTISIATSVLSIILFFPVRYPVDCVARIEPTSARVVAAPFNALLLECAVRPGDTVTENQVLFVLDGRPLRIERESIQAELSLATKEREVALAARRIADSQQAELKQRQLERRAQLLDDRLESLQVRSPIDGIVVSGDLDRYVGAPLETGQMLVEVAPLDKLRVELEIPETEIGYVEQGSLTRIRFTAADQASMYQELQSISPAAELREGTNVFVGRVELSNDTRLLRPGMQGEATTFGPIRPLCWRIARGAWERVLWWVGY